MSRSSRGQIPGEGERAVALQYSPGNGAPVIVASGMVEIYVYFLNFDPKDPEKFRRERNKQTGPAAGGEKT